MHLTRTRRAALIVLLSVTAPGAVAREQGTKGELNETRVVHELACECECERTKERPKARASGRGIHEQGTPLTGVD